MTRLSFRVASPPAERQAVRKRDDHRVPLVVPQGYGRAVTRSAVVPQPIDDWHSCEGGSVTVDENLHVVAAGLLVREGRGLLMHRAPGRRWYPDCWDLPGGHVEVGESPPQALRRELHEELAVTGFVTGAPFAQVRGADFRMDVWIVDRWDGEPTNADPAEHDAFAWLNDLEMAALRLADPRLPALVEAALR